MTLVLHQAAGRARLPPLRTPRAGALGVPGLRLGLGGAPRHRHRAARARAGASWSIRCRCSGSTPTWRPRRASRACCARSRRPRPGVLVGTQMVAKGHDFPDVTLGVVLDADATLRFPDFRAEERTFALVAQLAGRSGPRRPRRAGDRAGARARRARPAPRRRGTTPRASWRTSCRAARHSRYPPYGHLIRVVCSATEPRARSTAAAAGPARADRGRRGAGARPGAAVPPAGPLARPARDPLARARARDRGREGGGRGGRRRPRARRGGLRRGRRSAVGRARRTELLRPAAGS